MMPVLDQNEAENESTAGDAVITKPKTLRALTELFLPLEGLSNEEKKELLKREGVPFLTLVGLPGHIMLYVGTHRGEPLVFHNTWGIRTDRKGIEGRHIIGRAVVTTLDLGGDLPEHAPGKLLIDRINRLSLPAEEGAQ